MTTCTLGLLLFDGAEELDFAGPFEVFTMARDVTVRRDDAPAFRVVLISESGNDVTGAKGMRVGVDCSTADAPPLDVVCVPGGRGTRQVIKQPGLVKWVADTAANCDWVTSVCTGSFVLAAAGLTRGRAVTTHRDAMTEYKSLGLEGTLRESVRFVRDGNLVTSAGVSAGIDMALWLTGQIHGVGLARATQHAMQYDPAPPYTADT